MMNNNNTNYNYVDNANFKDTFNMLCEIKENRIAINKKQNGDTTPVPRITQKEVAEAIGMDKSTFCKKIKNKLSFTWREITELARFFEVPVGIVMGYDKICKEVYEGIVNNEEVEVRINEIEFIKYYKLISSENNKLVTKLYSDNKIYEPLMDILKEFALSPNSIEYKKYICFKKLDKLLNLIQSKFN